MRPQAKPPLDSSMQQPEGKARWARWFEELLNQLIYTTSPGTVVQVADFQTGAVDTGTTILPIDDTIPQNDEGDQYMLLTVTPKKATNLLRIEVVCHLAHTSGARAEMAAALFQDSIADAIAAGVSAKDLGANSPSTVVFSHNMLAGTVDPITFKVRAGGHVAGTTTFNGVSSGRIFGGVMASSIRITEYVA